MPVSQSELEEYVKQRSAVIRAAMREVAGEESISQAVAQSGGFSSGAISVGSAVIWS